MCPARCSPDTHGAIFCNSRISSITDVFTFFFSPFSKANKISFCCYESHKRNMNGDFMMMYEPLWYVDYLLNLIFYASLMIKIALNKCISYISVIAWKGVKHLQNCIIHLVISTVECVKHSANIDYIE